MSDPAREQRQTARLGGRWQPRAAKRLREAVAEVEVGDDVGAPPESLLREIGLERREGAGGFVKLDQRRRPSVIR
jgi:hypothetical protein